MTPTREPRWHRADRLHRRRVPAHVRPWLLVTGSLTAHVRALCPGDFRLRVLRQRRACPRPDEARALRLGYPGRVLLREVALCCGERPLVIARTVIPLSSLRGRRRRLAGLGRQPLGELLFADRSTRRGALAIARVDLRQAGVRDTPRGQGRVWGRRAVFRIGGAPLLVAEYFLPALYERTANERE